MFLLILEKIRWIWKFWFFWIKNDGWLLIPKGYAHGFLFTSEETVLFYKVDEYYNKNNDFGIIWNDPFNVPWPCDKKNNFSEKVNLYLIGKIVK